MKKLLFIIIALISMGIVLSSCSKDDDNNSPTYSIVGVWKRSTNMLGVYQFNKDNSYLYWAAYYDENVYNKEPREKGTYTFDGKHLSFDGGFKQEVIFSEDGTKIIFDNREFHRVK